MGPNLTVSIPGIKALIVYGRSYVYYTQVMQAETLAAAYRLWRRNWAGKGREYTAGALVWQVRMFTTLLLDSCADVLR